MPAIRFRVSIPLALALLCGPPSVGADVLEKSKSVRVVTTSGKTYSGLLVDRPGSTVRVRLRLNERPSTFKASEVASIVSGGKTYKYDGENDRWEAESSDAPKEKKLAKAGAAKEKAASVPATRTVTAEGVGDTPEEARKDAIRDAVHKVAGALVVGTTTVENDKIIQDKVLIYSDGVIVGDSYKEVERKKEGDIWRIKISATVVNRKLAERLVAAGFEVRKIDGVGIAAAVMSRTEARKRATELLQAALEDLPKIVVAHAAKPTEADYDEDTGELNVVVRVAADMKRYEAAADRLAAVLDKVSVSAARFAFAGEVGKAFELSRVDRDGRRRERRKGEAAIRLLPVEIQQSRRYIQLRLAEEQKGWYLWLMTNCKQDYSAVAWNVYHLDCDHEEAVKHLVEKPVLVMTLLDKKKKVIATKEIDLSLTVDRVKINGWMFSHATTEKETEDDVKWRATANVGIAPLYLWGKSFSPSQVLKVPIEISLADLRRLDKITCEVEFRK